MKIVNGGKASLYFTFSGITGGVAYISGHSSGTISGVSGTIEVFLSTDSDREGFNVGTFSGVTSDSILAGGWNVLTPTPGLVTPKPEALDEKGPTDE